MLREVILRILREQLDQNTINIKNKYVGEGKPMTEEDFQKLMEVTGGKFYLLSWLAKKVGLNIIKAEDIYKYKEYFEIFEKNKNKGRFKHKDIHLYKTAEDVLDFIEEVIKVREGDIKFSETSGLDNYVSQDDIRKLEETKGIKFLGMYEGYQVFQIFKIHKDVWKLYRDILGKCKGRSEGAKIEICTISSFQYFKDYLKDPKGSSYFLLYNLNDPKSPYQLHYESGQFMDKNDSERINIDYLKFFEWISKLVPKYSLESEQFPGNFPIPVPGKGYRDEKGRKQGSWRLARYGQLESIITYKNGLERGPFEFYENGNIMVKGYNGPNDKNIGDYVEYRLPGKIRMKGTFDNSGQKIGNWIEYADSDRYVVTNYDTKPIQTSGFTKNGNLQFVGSIKDKRQEVLIPVGNTVFFYKSGNPKAMGRFGTTGAFLGDWEFYTPKGEIKSKGRYLRGNRVGRWTDLVKTSKGEFIFVADFDNGYPYNKVKIFSKNGDFIKKTDWRNIKGDRAYWHIVTTDLKKTLS